MTEREKKIALHAKNTKERASELKTIKASYKTIAKTPAFLDLLQKATELIKYHEKIAKDGVGYKSVTAPDGEVKQELIYFTPEKRLGELDRAAGIEELVAYAERMSTGKA